MKKIISIFSFAALVSCTDSTTTVTTTKDSSSSADNSVTAPAPEKPSSQTPPNSETGSGNCYVYIVQRDTMVLHVTGLEGNISGKLSFDNYEKDGSSGPVSGTRNGDIIKLLYTFNSEGMTSVAEEYFKISGNDLLLGTGEPSMKGDTSYFADPSKIKYNGGKFVKTDCSNVPAKYKY